MKPFANWTKGVIVSAAMSIAGGGPAMAATFVYVSNAEDGDIGVYRLLDSGELQAAGRAKAANIVMPMTVSPDRKLLYAASRSKPFTVHTYAIDSATGALKPLSTAPLVESFPYIALDRTGRYLFGASYGAGLVTVNAVGPDGRVSGDALQVIPTGRNAHSIITDNTNRFVYVPHLGTDQIFQFVLDPGTGRLTSNTPAVVQMKPMTGPRHIIVSSDNRFVYLLNELVATVTTLSLDPKTGFLTEVSSASALPPDTKLVPGAPRGAVGVPGSAAAQHRQRHLGLRPSPDAEREVSLRGRADQQHDRRVQRRRRDRQAHLHREHADREAAARVRDRSEGQVPDRERREVGHDLGLRDRPGDRRAPFPPEVSDRQGLELGGDRELRLTVGRARRITHGVIAFPRRRPPARGAAMTL